MGEYVSSYTGNKIDELLGMVDQGYFAQADHTHEINNIIMWSGEDENEIPKFLGEGSAVAFDHGKNEGEFHKVSEQSNGIVLVFSLFDEEAKNASWSCHFVPKSMIGEDGLGKQGTHTFLMATPASEMDYFGIKHLNISDTRIDGYARNGETYTSDCGIKYSNNKYVLRYVIGV